MGAHIQASFQHLTYRLIISIRHMMLGLYKLHGLAVAHHISVETVFLAQQLRQEIIAGGHGHTVPIVIAAHHSHRMRVLNNFLKRIQEKFVQLTRSNVRVGTAMPVTTAFGDAVNRIMLQGGGYPLRLNTVHHFRSQSRYQKRFFSITLQCTSPTRVAYDIQYGSVHIGVSQRFRLLPGDDTGTTYKLFVPGTSDCDRGRQRSGFGVVQSVNTLIREVNGNPQTGFLHKPALHGIDSLGMVAERIQ